MLTAQGHLKHANTKRPAVRGDEKGRKVGQEGSHDYANSEQAKYPLGRRSD